MTDSSLKPVLITGGTGGLGHAVVRRLLPEYRCIVPYIVEQEWQSLLRENADSAGTDQLHGVHLDITDADALTAALSELRDQHGPLYGVVHLAGGFSGGSVAETTIDDWNKLLTLNLTSVFLVLHAVVPQLQERGVGRVITIGSAAALERPAGLVTYNVSKIGVQVLTESLAHELKQTRITANTVLPGSMATPAMLSQMPRDQLVPLERVADTIAFLLSDAAASISGASIPVTGTGNQ